jgi:hypothetical protein
MYSIYIIGDTYHLKEDIKKIKPKRKDFKNWWKYNYDFKAWELSVPNHCYSKKFSNRIQFFCDEHNLKVEILEFTKLLTKSMNDFESHEAFFAYLHSQNNKNIKFK